MKFKNKIKLSILTIVISMVSTCYLFPSSNRDYLTQLQGTDLTNSHYNVEITVFLWVLCGIINAVVWKSRVKAKEVKKEIIFDFSTALKDKENEHCK